MIPSGFSNSEFGYSKLDEFVIGPSGFGLGASSEKVKGRSVQKRSQPLWLAGFIQLVPNKSTSA